MTQSTPIFAKLLSAVDKFCGNHFALTQAKMCPPPLLWSKREQRVSEWVARHQPDFIVWRDAERTPSRCITAVGWFIQDRLLFTLSSYLNWSFDFAVVYLRKFYSGVPILVRVFHLAVKISNFKVKSFITFDCQNILWNEERTICSPLNRWQVLFLDTVKTYWEFFSFWLYYNSKIHNCVIVYQRTFESKYHQNFSHWNYKCDDSKISNVQTFLIDLLPKCYSMFFTLSLFYSFFKKTRIFTNYQNSIN